MKNPLDSSSGSWHGVAVTEDCYRLVVLINNPDLHKSQHSLRHAEYYKINTPGKSYLLALMGGSHSGLLPDTAILLLSAFFMMYKEAFL